MRMRVGDGAAAEALGIVIHDHLVIGRKGSTPSLWKHPSQLARRSSPSYYRARQAITGPTSAVMAEILTPMQRPDSSGSSASP